MCRWSVGCFFVAVGRNCQSRISSRYLLVELLTAALFLACYSYFGLTLAALKYCVFGFLLLGLIFTDAENKLLPDKLTLPGFALGRAVQFAGTSARRSFAVPAGGGEHSVLS